MIAPSTSGRRVRLGRWAATLFDALVPASCVGCRRGVDARGAPLCALCRSRLPRLPEPLCRRCAEPLGSLPAAVGAPVLCGACESWPESLVAATAPFAFDGRAADVVRALKYDRWLGLAPWMAECMAPGLRAMRRALAERIPEGHSAQAAWLVPVPLAPARLRERGFNQAEALAAELARQGMGELRPALERRTGGKRQAKMGGAARLSNVRGLFRVPEDCAVPAGGPRAVVIVDDVLTTGSTVIACAEALAEAGFGPLAAVSFARTLRPLDREDSE